MAPSAYDMPAHAATSERRTGPLLCNPKPQDASTPSKLRRREVVPGLPDSASDLSVNNLVHLPTQFCEEPAEGSKSPSAEMYSVQAPRSPRQKVGAGLRILGVHSRNPATGALRLSIDSIIVQLLAVFALVTRLINASRGNRVIWDEAHFGKFASYYIKREFYFDVHPPLGKMLLGFAGWASGYNGSFPFESGHTYPEELNYTAMRGFCGIWGAFAVPLAYLSARALNFSRWAALTTASLILFDNALTVISRFILLDSMLLFFTALGFYCWTKFVRTDANRQPFTIAWWSWLTCLGVALGAVSSVKWVGLFLVAVVGLHTVENLWDLFGNPSVSPGTYIKHWLARILCLIIIPCMVYLATFAVHFAILNRSGPGDSQMSSLFQANLVGSQLKNSPLEIAYGSKITLRSNAYGGGILHSHAHAYPHGSKQQQVTCYHHRDQNNEFIVLPKRNSDGTVAELPERGNASEPVFLQNGDTIRLFHATTKRNLHSHPLAAPLTKRNYEVSAYGDESIGDLHDNWIIEYVSDLRRGSAVFEPGARIHTLNTRLRLRHQVTGCLLRSNTRPLPEWGYKQHEVACDRSPPNGKGDNSSMNNMWNIEQHWHEQLPLAEPASFDRRFFDDFLNVNFGMWTTNNALVPDPDKEPDALTSSPSDWPLLTRTLRMCSWGDVDIKFLMIGNPLVWWSGAASIAAFVGAYAWYSVLMKRRLGGPWSPGSWHHFSFTGKWLLVAWAMHFLPFALMGRVLYLHHYFPALYFSAVLAGFVLDHLFRRFPATLRGIIHIGFIAAVGSVFFFFAPLTYGYDKPIAEFAKTRTWRESWNIA